MKLLKLFSLGLLLANCTSKQPEGENQKEQKWTWPTERLEKAVNQVCRYTIR